VKVSRHWIYIFHWHWVNSRGRQTKLLVTVPRGDQLNKFSRKRTRQHLDTSEICFHLAVCRSCYFRWYETPFGTDILAARNNTYWNVGPVFPQKGNILGSETLVKIDVANCCHTVADSGIDFTIDSLETEQCPIQGTVTGPIRLPFITNQHVGSECRTPVVLVRCSKEQRRDTASIYTAPPP